ncbi:MAG TPA: hypothetical protein VF976_01785 [Gemmatimonadales bacterium]
MKLWSCCIAVAAVACGGDKATGPAPCDTYTGGILSGNSGFLPGSYVLRSYCQGTKPDIPGGNGSVTIGPTNFSASIGAATYSGTYTASAPDGITVDLSSPLPATFVGTYRLRNDSLAVSGTVAGQRLSLVGTRGP